MTEEQNQQLTNDQFILNSIDSVEKVTEELSELVMYPTIINLLQ